MALMINRNTEQIFMVDTINSLATETLMNSKNTYPFCAVTQFMLAKKMYLKNDIHFSRYVSITTAKTYVIFLYFLYFFMVFKMLF